MDLVIFIAMLFVGGVIGVLGFVVHPPNPYLVLFSSFVLFLVSMGLIAEGLSYPTGTEISTLNETRSNSINQTEINITTTETKSPVNSTLNYHNLRFGAFILIMLLLSLYMAFFSIGEILEDKYGKGRG